MDNLPVYFFGLLAYNIAPALIAFVIMRRVRRRHTLLTLVRGLAVLLVGWFVGSVIVLILHVLFSLSGFNYRAGSLEIIISLIVLCAVMYPLFGWFCKNPKAPTSQAPNA